MPRHHRRRDQGDETDDRMERLVAGWRRVETRRGIDWNVQPVSGAAAVKEYVCPGCGRAIEPGTAHLVAWRADGVLGDASDLAGRRHWHAHCWRIGA
jgi:hypothetical protein